MAFINDDNDIWGDASSKTSEGKFNSAGGGMVGTVLQGVVAMAGTPRRLEDREMICLQMRKIFSWRKIYHAAVVGIAMLLKICGSESANEPASEPPNDVVVRA